MSIQNVLRASILSITPLSMLIGVFVAYPVERHTTERERTNTVLPIQTLIRHDKTSSDIFANRTDNAKTRHLLTMPQTTWAESAHNISDLRVLEMVQVLPDEDDNMEIFQGPVHEIFGTTDDVGVLAPDGHIYYAHISQIRRAKNADKAKKLYIEAEFVNEEKPEKGLFLSVPVTELIGKTLSEIEDFMTDKIDTSGKIPDNGCFSVRSIYITDNRHSS